MDVITQIKATSSSSTQGSSRQASVEVTLPITCAWLPRETCLALRLASCAPCDRYREAMSTVGNRSTYFQETPQQLLSPTFRCMSPKKKVSLKLAQAAAPAVATSTDTQTRDTTVTRIRRHGQRKRKALSYDDYIMAIGLDAAEDAKENEEKQTTGRNKTFVVDKPDTKTQSPNRMAIKRAPKPVEGAGETEHKEVPQDTQSLKSNQEASPQETRTGRPASPATPKRSNTTRQDLRYHHRRNLLAHMTLTPMQRFHYPDVQGSHQADSYRIADQYHLKNSPLRPSHAGMWEWNGRRVQGGHAYRHHPNYASMAPGLSTDLMQCQRQAPYQATFGYSRPPMGNCQVQFPQVSPHTAPWYRTSQPTRMPRNPSALAPRPFLGSEESNLHFRAHCGHSPVSLPFPPPIRGFHHSTSRTSTPFDRPAKQRRTSRHPNPHPWDHNKTPFVTPDSCATRSVRVYAASPSTADSALKAESAARSGNPSTLVTHSYSHARARQGLDKIIQATSANNTRTPTAESLAEAMDALMVILYGGKSTQTKVEDLCQVLFHSFVSTHPEQYKNVLIQEAMSFLERQGFQVQSTSPTER